MRKRKERTAEKDSNLISKIASKLNIKITDFLDIREGTHEFYESQLLISPEDVRFRKSSAT